MTVPPRLSSTPAGIRLGRLDLIAEGAARSFVVQLPAGRFHGFVVRSHGAVTGYVDRCPHAGLPLARILDDYLVADGALIHCSWHGALFDVSDGRCIAGPCKGAALSPWPVEVEGEAILTGPPRR